MPAPAAPTQPVPPEKLRFTCRHCGMALEVPVTLAGVTGPCPACQKEVTAPSVSMASPVTMPVAAQPLKAPMPVRGTNPVAAAPAATGSDQPPPHRRGMGRAPRLVHAAVDGPVPPRLRQLRVGRSFWRKASDFLMAGALMAVCLAWGAALLFSHPVSKGPVTPSLPDNLYELVQQEQREMEKRRSEAAVLALAAVQRFLSAPDAATAAALLIPLTSAPPPVPHPPFSGLDASKMEVRLQRRLPGSDSYLTLISGPEEGSPVFVVEETPAGPRLHHEALAQQTGEVFARFIATPGEGEALLYAHVRPTSPEDERANRSQRPDLAGYQFVDITSPFPMPEPRTFLACLEPGTPAAHAFSRRAHDVAWRPAIVRVRWERHRESGPFASVAGFTPCAWSGERTAASSPPLARRD